MRNVDEMIALGYADGMNGPKEVSLCKAHIAQGRLISEGFTKGLENPYPIPTGWIDTGDTSIEHQLQQLHEFVRGTTKKSQLARVIHEEGRHDIREAMNLAEVILSKIEENAIQNAAVIAAGVMIENQTKVEQQLHEALAKSEEQNMQLRRANSKLKGVERHLKRVIRGYKEQLEQAHPHKHKYRNRNHQGKQRGNQR